MKIAIVDDHQIIIDGIEMLLGLEKNIAILKTYTDACDFLQDMRERKDQSGFIVDGFNDAHDERIRMCESPETRVPQS